MSNQKEQNELTIGMEGIIHGFRWIQIDEVNEDGSGWGIDQDGESHEVTIGDFDHIY
jgi:hypothetical protein